jgi:hypothetical protein
MLFVVGVGFAACDEGPAADGVVVCDGCRPGAQYAPGVAGKEVQPAPAPGAAIRGWRIGG